MKPRTYQERLTASEQQSKRAVHPNFQNLPQDPWQEEGYNPNTGFNQQAPQQQQVPPPPPRQQPVFNPPPPELPPAPQQVMESPTDTVAAARQQKEREFGIPVIAPGEIGPPPNLVQPVAELPDTSGPTEASIMSAKVADISFGRSVNKKHKETLASNGVITLYDAMKLGNSGLEAINGIGAGVSSAVMIEVDRRLAA